MFLVYLARLGELAGVARPVAAVAQLNSRSAAIIPVAALLGNDLLPGSHLVLTTNCPEPRRGSCL